MKNESVQQLHQTFPRLFAMSPYISCREGWLPLIEAVCQIIEAHLTYFPEEVRNQLYITQIKEKFGSLRFYVNHEDDYLTGAITMAEYLSNSVCEVCGSFGSQRRIGTWIQTLCDADNEKATQEYNEKQR
jgi:hypothetical protein